MTSKLIRRAQKAYKANPTKANLDVILWSQERLATQHEIDKYLQSGLLETLSNKRKRRKRRKKLNLVSEENSSAFLHYSSTLRVALTIEAEREAIAIAEKAEKDARKAQVAEDKQIKDAMAQEKALQRQVEGDVKAAAAAKKLAIKEAKKEQSELLKKNVKKSLIVVLPYKKASDYSTKVVVLTEKVDVAVEEEGSKLTQTRTRKINLPMRYKM